MLAIGELETHLHSLKHSIQIEHFHNPTNFKDKAEEETDEKNFLDRSV